mmetsp:Transcript_96320/g.171148  ORF Transcript_96320/g.171148 Transcript_96320/m.171148 type:complete len:628 (+) Transcript_96320:108-1991(+)|eukprot:CAMPEP_0197640746 /NCGR_PEP_ID=MMETSP1338-20131121/14923_1 /TAXON_ID=43686 ORGANISM="Pelagodinium beii, Strain RCC1491" /NCGR_SAMPLE_ID=MMETSP1338 /ASSEMBLY_ACC=CAM_ASM_000754 /LENGTH=627 /DNA_ID=CAMNT_0043213617 /DNA_START=101 /DNA_END=1984 /DNA_ORIENTATION=-
MAKRSEHDEQEQTQKRAKVLEGPVLEAHLEALVQERMRHALAKSETLPLLMRETFTVNCPVHGLMHLPGIVKVVVDTMNFQRMRQIKQLGLCALVYPGATHNRFFHSIGTAFLAWELVKSLRQRQPELGITNRDALCAVLAGLCHDLGHPSYSHMFEVFVHSLAREMRMQGEKDEALLKKYEKWNHEEASVMLLKQMFKDLKDPLQQAGLRSDEHGDDFACIAELIDPPKKDLETMLNENKLSERWSTVIKGRPVQKAWLYEIVSNWRSGIDVDKFDYFRRDAQYLGIQRQFDHNRYLKGVKVVHDDGGVLTISPPEKDKDSLRENLMELRKMLHGTAYQHKTVKKMEAHMVDILKQMDEVLQVTGVDGKKMRMSEAAVNLDPVAYPKLTDTFVEYHLLSREDPALQKAADDYQRHVLQRQMMRRVAEWDPPRIACPGVPGPEAFAIPDSEELLAGLLKEYPAAAKSVSPDHPVRPVPLHELRCQVAKIHYGMGAYDPITRIVFHCTKSDTSRGFRMDGEAKPLRQKVFIFWNPPIEEQQDAITLQRLTLAFLNWARPLVEGGDVVTTPASPVKRKRTSIGATVPVPTFEQEPAQPVTVAPPAAHPPVVKPRRMLRVQSSCPPDPVP